MFEDYIQDGYTFYKLAEKNVKNANEREAKMFYRASVFCSASALEAFVNFIGDTLKRGGQLDKIEIAFLNDKVLEISPTKAKLEERTKFNSIEGKIKFIITKFAVDIDTSKSADWTNFTKFKSMRDSLVHSKNISDDNDVTTYKKAIKDGLNANIEIMNKISSKLFSKPLRKSLLDLKI